MIEPSGSEEPLPSKSTGVPTVPEYGPLASANGGRGFAVIVAVVDCVSAAPALSVTVSATVNVPADSAES